ncbi:MAG: hypothetical protein AAGI69_28725 [Cyanobacteria bacterium P01_H01_bin.21]
MTTVPEDTQKILDMLKQVATEILEKNRRLGHYVLVWRDGKVTAIGDDAPEMLSKK